MSIKQLLQKTISQLQKQGIPNSHLDAEILLAEALEKSKEFLYAHPEDVLSKKVETRLIASLQRRLNREPIAYIINKKEFYGREFYVDSRVLIPRPETEQLVQNSKFKIQNYSSKFKIKNEIFFIDVGTGSGCVIISLLREILDHNLIKQSDNITYIATDISSGALEVAKINAKKHKVDHLIKFYQGNLLEPVLKYKDAINRVSTYIVANLPYITPQTYQTLQPEIKKHEPKLALLTPEGDANYYYKKLDKQIDQLQKITEAKIYRFYEQP